MKTTPVTAADLGASVIAAPPLARHRDLTINNAANLEMIRYLEEGGVTTLLYGGNANLYNISIEEYPELLDMLEEDVADDTWVIPSVGPDFGKLEDQAAILKGRAFPTVMVLPLGFPATSDGVVAGIHRFAERIRKPVVVYLKSDNYLEPAEIAALVNEGIVCAVKYGTVRKNPSDDPYLRKLLDLVDAKLVVSATSERPALVHLRDFGLRAFASGSACIAPRGATKLLRLATAGDWDGATKERAAFLPLEDYREKFSPIRTLHDAVTLAGIADMGPMLPMLSNLPATVQLKVREVALALRQHDEGLAAV